MKKTILVGFIAALMLFAFVACDNSVGYKVPTGITVSAAKTEYLVGEPLDLNNFTATVAYSDGTEGTIPGSSLSYTTVPSTGTAKQVKVEVEYAGFKATTYINVAAVDAVAITNLPKSVGVDAEGKAVADLTGVTVAVGSRTLAADEYTLAVKSSNAVSADTVTFTDSHVTFTLFGKAVADATYTFDGKTSWTVAVDKKVQAPVTLTGIEMGYYTVSTENGKTVYTEMPANEQPRWIGDDVTGLGDEDKDGFFVLGVYSDGSKEALTAGNPGTEKTYTVTSGSIPENGTGLPAKAVTFSIVSNDAPTLNAPSFEFVGEDYISSVTFTKDTENFPTKFTTATELTKAMFDATATYASGEKDEAFTDFEFLTTKLQKGNSQKIYIYWVDKDNEMQWDSKLTVNVVDPE